MNDNALFSLVRTTILAGLAAQGLDGWSVARRFQPDAQGANAGPTVYLFNVGPEKRYGWPEARETWDDAAGVMRLDEWQQCETTIQASVELRETTDPAALTPNDACSVVAAIMQSAAALDALRALEVGILRVGEVRNPYNVNDANRYEANPSFDFVLTHRRGGQGTAPFAVTVEGSVNRV